MKFDRRFVFNGVWYDGYIELKKGVNDSYIWNFLIEKFYIYKDFYFLYNGIRKTYKLNRRDGNIAGFFTFDESDLNYLHAKDMVITLK